MPGHVHKPAPLPEASSCSCPSLDAPQSATGRSDAVCSVDPHSLLSPQQWRHNPGRCLSRRPVKRHAAESSFVLATQGLPHETVTWWFPMPEFSRQIGLAVIVCIIDVLESISIAKALAYKNGYDLK